MTCTSPPVDLHHPLPDGSRLEQPGQPAELLDAHPRVVAVLTGVLVVLGVRTAAA
ncbi:hypothetical protein [Streptomyces sp. NPDC002889]|uniref:hypothetical protein n=1 Tax=Streptomyces sp. NPDC002889 TaxID=3364669 RepID=UPI0036D00855